MLRPQVSPFTRYSTAKTLQSSCKAVKCTYICQSAATLHQPAPAAPHWPGRHLQRSGQDGGRAGQRRAKLSALLSRQRFPASATGRGKEKEKTNSEQLGRSADTVNTCGPNMWWEQRFRWTMTNSFCDRVCVCGRVCSRPVGLQLCIRLPCSILGHRPFMKVIC